MRLAWLIPRYLIALLITFGAFWIYAQLIAPLIEGESRVVRAAPPTHFGDQPDFREDLKGLLPADGWEWEPCTILQTKQGKILFEDNRVLNDGSVELKPLTMILYPKGSEASTEDNENQALPIVLRAPQGARLKFEKAMTVNSDLGELQNGHLIGDVQIYRPESVAEPGESFSLITQNVQITPERIFTPYETSFRFGKSYGRGKYLEVDLTNSRDGDRSAFSGVDRIKLARVYELYLHRKPKSKSAKFTPVRSTADAGNGDLLGDTQRSLLVSSAGPFVFDFSSNKATFDKQVSIRSTDGSGDQLTCDQLTVLFEKNKAPSAEPDTEQEQRIDVSELIATGTPAVINSPAKNAEISADSSTLR